jgi:hypothetical protein
VAVALAIVLVVASSVVWMRLDRLPPEWDHANHLERSVHCAADLQGGEWRQLVERSSFYPPIVPCAAGVLYRLWPSDVMTAQVAIWIFLVMGAVATFLLARHVAGDAAGAMAAVLFVTAPFTIFLSLRFQLDLPLASMVAVFLLTLVWARDLRSVPVAIGAGALFGLGMLTKPTFAVYALPASVVVMARARGWRAAGNVALAVLVAMVVSLPWYGPRLFGMAGQMGRRSFEQAAESGYPAAMSVAGLTYYPRWLVSQFGFAAAILLVIGAAVALKRRSWWLLTTLIVPFALVELVQNKNLRYTLPLFPVAAVVAGLGFAALPRPARAVAAVVVAGFAALQLTMTVVGWPPAVTLPVVRVPAVVASAPRLEDWRQREILDVIARDRAAGGGPGPARISVVPNHAYFSVSNFRYYAVRDGRPMEFTRAWDEDPMAVDYMILKTGDVGPAWTEAKPRRINARLASDASLTRVFPVLGVFELPDRSTATLRGRRVPDVDVDPATLAHDIEVALRRRLPSVARDVEGLTVTVSREPEIRRGRVRRLEIVAAAARLGEFDRRDRSALRVSDVRLVVDDLLVNPVAAHVDQRLDLLDVGRFRIARATVAGSDLAAFLAGDRKTRGIRVTLRDTYAHFALVQPGPNVTARVRLLPATDRPFAVVTEDVRLAGVRVPDALVNWVVRGLDPSRRIASRLPMRVEIGDVHIAPDAIRIVSAW